MKFKNILWLVFLLVALIDILGRIYNWPQTHYIFKPMLMPLLALIFYLSIEQKVSYVYLLLMGLLLSWFGDVFLLFADNGQYYFMAGLVSFLLAHLCYMVIFIKQSSKFKPQLFTYATGFTLVIYGFLLIVLLWPGLGTLKVPVIIYMLVIMGMGLSALFRKSIGGNLVLVGAFLFIASDSLLAINKFNEPIADADFWIMLTYILAQYFIVTGMLRSFLDSRKDQSSIGVITK